MKIDIFTHFTPVKYADLALKVQSNNTKVERFRQRAQLPLYYPEERFKIMDMFEDMTQVLTLCGPGIEEITGPEKAVDLAKVANDELAELVAKYPDRFVAAVAVLPLNNIDEALKETDRAINELNLKGVLLFSNVNGKALDSPGFLPIFEKMEQYDLPIWIHPARGTEFADYRTEDRSRYGIDGEFDLPHETTVAMARLAYSGVMAKYPDLKFITHHCGGTIPYMASRVVEFQDSGAHHEEPEHETLRKKRIEYLKTFYTDTAIYGGLPTLTCCFEFFGSEHMLFGTDMPMSVSEPGISGIRRAIDGIDRMTISDSDKKKIYEDNARHLLHLS